jgi:hypothetical protein
MLDIETREFRNAANDLPGLEGRAFEIGAAPEGIDVDGAR